MLDGAIAGRKLTEPHFVDDILVGVCHDDRSVEVDAVAAASDLAEETSLLNRVPAEADVQVGERRGLFGEGDGLVLLERYCHEVLPLWRRLSARQNCVDWVMPFKHRWRKYVVKTLAN
ncbi:hypothetical protein D3C87_1876500 [compost metagenome]